MGKNFNRVDMNSDGGEDRPQNSHKPLLNASEYNINSNKPPLAVTNSFLCSKPLIDPHVFFFFFLCVNSTHNFSPDSWDGTSGVPSLFSGISVILSVR